MNPLKITFSTCCFILHVFLPFSSPSTSFVSNANKIVQVSTSHLFCSHSNSERRSHFTFNYNLQHQSLSNTMKTLTSFITWFILFLGIVHGYKIDVNQYSPDLSASSSESNEGGKGLLLRALLDQASTPMEIRPRRVGSMGWGPGGSPMSSTTGLYIMCVERSRSMGSNAGQCSSFLAAKKWDPTGHI